jgi:Uma2 family endonuclease
MSTPGARQSFRNLDGILPVDAWLALPDTKPRYELIEGRLIQKPLKDFAQVKALSEFFFCAACWAQDSDWQFLVEGIGVQIDLYNGLVPNTLGFAPDFPIARGQQSVVAPSLVAEVLAPKTTRKASAQRQQLYARGGVPLYVLIDPDKYVLKVFRSDEPGHQYGEPEVLNAKDTWQPAELPGLHLETRKLWLD